MIKIFSILALCLAFFAPVSYAQNQTEPDIPDHYIQEAADILQSCQGQRTLMLYYDCECRAMRFLEERVKRGDTATQGRIEMAIQGDCRDATQAAGAEYGTCLSSYYQNSGTVPVEQFCECYANRFAEIVTSSNAQIRYARIVPMRVQALEQCRNPAFAERYAASSQPEDGDSAISPETPRLQ